MPLGGAVQTIGAALVAPADAALLEVPGGVAGAALRAHHLDARRTPGAAVGARLPGPPHRVRGRPPARPSRASPPAACASSTDDRSNAPAVGATGGSAATVRRLVEWTTQDVAVIGGSSTCRSTSSPSSTSTRRILEASQSWERTSGGPPQQLIGRSLLSCSTRTTCPDQAELAGLLEGGDAVARGRAVPDRARRLPVGAGQRSVRPRGRAHLRDGSRHHRADGAGGGPSAPARARGARGVHRRPAHRGRARPGDPERDRAGHGGARARRWGPTGATSCAAVTAPTTPPTWSGATRRPAQREHVPAPTRRCRTGGVDALRDQRLLRSTTSRSWPRRRPHVVEALREDGVRSLLHVPLPPHRGYWGFLTMVAVRSHGALQRRRRPRCCGWRASAS